ncbi:MAG: ABC transporter permease subunit [Promethearchaeota archaeon]
MFINFGRIIILMEKDWSDIKKSKYVIMTIFGIPFLMAILMPLSIVAPYTFMSKEEAEEESLPYLDKLPAPIPNWNELSDQQQSIVAMVYFSHLFFLIIPCVLPSVIAADSIAGEKERKSFEAILATPLTDTEILLGKIGTPFLLGMLGTYLGAIPYVILTNLLTYSKLDFFVVPDLNFLLLLVFLSPLAGLLTAISMVFVSSRVSSTRDAQQLGGLIVLPLLLLLFGQIVLAFFSPLTIVLGACIFGLIDFFLFRMALKIFSREAIITKYT